MAPIIRKDVKKIAVLPKSKPLLCSKRISKRIPLKFDVVGKVFSYINLFKSDLNTHLKSLLVSYFNMFYNSKCLLHEDPLYSGRTKDYEKFKKLITRLKEVTPWALNTFILKEPKNSARYFAGYLWNMTRLHIPKNESKLEYFNYYVQKTVESMGNEDINVLYELLKLNYEKYWCEIDSTNAQGIRKGIYKYLWENKHNIWTIIKTIHHWFLTFPILQELSKNIGWDFLKNTGAFTLDVDVLYEVLVHRTYTNIDL